MKRGPISDAALVGTVTAHSGRCAQLWHMLPVFRNYVDDPKEGAGDVEGRIRPSDHLHAVNQVDVNWEVRSNQVPVVDAIVVLPRKSKPAHAQVAIVSVVIDVKARYIP